MKKVFTLLSLFVSFTISAQFAFVPDNAFESWCEVQGYGDGIANNDTISTQFTAFPSNISLDNLGISDLTGIEAFSSLTVLNVANNNLSSIDISFFGNQLGIFNALGNNSDLYCITVLDTAYAYGQAGYSVDAFTNYSLDCATAFGCMDPAACNWIPTASIDTVTGGSCYYNLFSSFSIDECDAYLFGGINRTVTGTYYDTLATTGGCDSVVTLNLIIRNSTESDTYDTICNTAVWNSLIVDISGTYDYYMPGANAVGCDSTAHLHAIVDHSYDTTYTEEHCDSYTWPVNGQTYTTTTTDVVSYQTTVGGCDSIIFLELTIYYSDADTDHQQHCNSFTWVNGITYTSSNNTATYMTTTVVGGCDSLVTLNLIINDSTFGTTFHTECDSYTWIDGNTYTSSGTHTYTNTNINGCVHTETLELTIDYSTSSTDPQIACDTFVWVAGDGATYTSNNNTATWMYQTIDGCDSLVTLDLTINNSSTGFFATTVCDEYDDTLGNNYTSTAIYTFVLTNAVGCDSTVTLDLTVNHLDSSLTTVDVCDSYTFNGTTHTTSGTYYFNTSTVHGCDSTAQLDLTIRYSDNNTALVVNACDNYVWFDADGDTIYTALNETDSLSGGITGTYGLDGHYLDTMVYTNQAGCDSTVYLDLTLTSSAVSSNQPIEIFACDEGWVGPDGITYTQSLPNVSIVTGQTPAGCDSIFQFNIHIADEKRSDITATACDTFTWIIDGDTTGYTASTIDSVVYVVNQNFLAPDSTILCDSIVYLNLTINNSEIDIQTEIHCDTYTWAGDGLTYTASSTTILNLLTVDGCDSTVILDLTINNSSSSTDTQIACDTFIWVAGDGVTYLASNNTATWMYQTIHGCDSLVTLDLTINPSYSTTLPPVIECDSFHWDVGVGGTGNTYYTTGLYTSYFPSIHGCDSLILLDLTIDNSHTHYDVITACDSYTWIDGVTYISTNNTATFMYQTVVGGCDSLIYLDLTINYSSTGVTSETACDSYIWDADTMYVSGAYNNTYTNASGCDSVHTLNLTINYSNTGVSAITACDSYSWNGQPISVTGTYLQTLTNAAGCDSVHTLNLTIDNTSITYDTVTACYSYDWIPMHHPNNTYGFDTTSTFNAGLNSLNYIVLDNSINSSVCTDTAYLNLTINPMVYGSGSDTACDSYLWGSNTYTSTGVYIDTLTSAVGCDSVATLNLYIKYSTLSDTTITVCDTLEYQTSNGIDIFTTSGDHDIVLSGANTVGCDSTITIHLTVLESTHSYHSITECDSLFWNGNMHYTSGPVSWISYGGNAVGCDSTAWLDLTINYSASVSENITACDSYTWQGDTYTADTVVTNTLSTIEGCDSTVTVNLTIGGLLGCTDTTACNYDPLAACDDTSCILPDGCGDSLYMEYDSLVTCSDPNACVTLILNGCMDTTACNYNSAATIDDSSCLTAYGCMDSTACNYDSTATCDDSSCNTVYGCQDSLYLEYDPLATCSDPNACVTLIINGCMDITACNYDSLANVDDGTCAGLLGCTDSTACNYNAAATCDDGSCIVPDGCTDATACNYDSTALCDDGSCVYDNGSIDTQEECDSYLWIDGNTYTASNSSATMVYPNAAGCDSTVTLDLTINESPIVTILVNGTNSNLFTAIVSGGIFPYTYAWTDLNSQIISVNPTLETSETGDYCVEVTDDNGCVSSEVCESIIINSVSELNISEFNIYPNPTTSYISLEFTTTQTADYLIKVMSYNGAEVYRDELLKFNGDYTTTIDLSTFAKGTYLVQISYEDRIIFRKVTLQ